MKLRNESIFNLSIIELFMIILFIGLTYSHIKINEIQSELDTKDEESSQTLDENQAKALEMEAAISLLTDSLRIIYGQLALQNNENTDLTDIGSGRGPCWKSDERSVSMLHLTIFDTLIEARGIWPVDYNKRSERIIGPDLANRLESNTYFSNDQFLNSFASVKNAGENESPPCYFVSDLVDSTTTKQDFFSQERIINQIFVINRKYLR